MIKQRVPWDSSCLRCLEVDDFEIYGRTRFPPLRHHRHQQCGVCEQPKRPSVLMIWFASPVGVKMLEKCAKGGCGASFELNRFSDSPWCSRRRLKVITVHEMRFLLPDGVQILYRELDVRCGVFWGLNLHEDYDMVLAEAKKRSKQHWSWNLSFLVCLETLKNKNECAVSCLSGTKSAQARIHGARGSD